MFSNVGHHSFQMAVEYTKEDEYPPHIVVSESSESYTTEVGYVQDSSNNDKSKYLGLFLAAYITVFTLANSFVVYVTSVQ